MWSDYSDMIEFKTLRNRIERRLNHGLLLLVHLVLFLGMIGYLMWDLRYTLTPETGYFMQRDRAEFMFSWSLLLGAHTVFTYVRSGLRAGRRDRVIEHELRERLELDDTRLLSDPRDAFRLHGLLADNIQQRARAIMPLFAFLLVMLTIWFLSGTGVVGSLIYTSFAWQMTLLLAVPFGMWLLVAQALRSRVDARQQRELTRYADYADKAKPKRDDFDPAALALSDDGELVAYDADDEQPRQRMER